MKQVLFDSTDIVDIAKDIWDRWNEKTLGKRPDDYWDSSIIDRACEDNGDVYRYIVDMFNQRIPSDLIILVGQLGLWNGPRFGYRVVKAENAFSWNFDDMSIYYEDGNIWIDEHHHDGTNTFCVLGLLDWDDLYGLPDDVYEDRYDFMQRLRNCCLMPEEFIKENLPSVTFSTAPYLCDFLAEDVLEDMKKHGLEIPACIK